MLLWLAVDMAPKRNPRRARLEAVAVMIDGQLTRRIARIDIGFVPIRTERKARRHSGVEVEIIFVEINVSAGRDRVPRRNPELLWRRRIIRDVPAAYIHRRCRWIE